MDYTKLATEESLATTISALTANGINVIRTQDSASALQKLLSLIPSGSEVMTMTSVTLDTIGATTTINESGQYISAKSRLYSLNRDTHNLDMQRLGSAPKYTVGSVHAITESGQIVVASNTGSQLPAYAYGSPHVIWVAGTHKIVPDLDTALKRLYEYTLPLESDRAKKAYGVPGSFVSKLLIINKEVNPSRLTLILVPEVLGF